jgi:hypothetical protein
MPVDTTSVEEIISNLSRIAGEVGNVNGRDIVDNIIFGEHKDTLKNIQNDYLSTFYTMAPNFKNLFIKIQSKIKDTNEQIDQLDSEINKKINSIKTDASNSVNKSDNVFNKSNNINSILGKFNTIQPADKEQQGFGEHGVEINFSKETKEFLSDLLLKKLKLPKLKLDDNDYSKIKRNLGGEEHKSGFFNNLLTGAEMGIGNRLLSKLLGTGAIGAAETTGLTLSEILGGLGGAAIIATTGGLILTSAYWDKIKPWIEKSFNVKLPESVDRGVRVGEDIGKIGLTGYTMHTSAKASQELLRRQNIIKAQEAAKTELKDLEYIHGSWVKKIGNKPLSSLTLKETKELESLENEIKNLKAIAFPELEIGTKFLKESVPVTKSLYGVMRGVFKGEFLAKAFGPAATKIGAKIFGTSLKALKVLPGIGALVSAYFAWDRYNKGDYIGSFLDSISAVADILSIVTAPTVAGPVVFEAISIGATVLEAILDWKGITGGDYTNTEEKKKRDFKIDKVFDGIGKMLSKSKFIGALLKGFSGISNLITSIQNGDIGGVASALGDLTFFPALLGLGSDIMNILGLDAPMETTSKGSFGTPMKKSKTYLEKEKELYEYNLAWGNHGGKKEEREKLQKEIQQIQQQDSESQRNSGETENDSDSELNDAHIKPMPNRKLTLNGKSYKVNDGDTITMMPYGGFEAEVKLLRESIISMHKDVVQILSKNQQPNNNNNISNINVSSQSNSSGSSNSRDANWATRSEWWRFTTPRGAIV